MFTNPQHNLEQVGIKDGMAVADFGSGSGEYTLYVARLVGENGKVFSVDVQKDLLTRIKNHAKEKGLANVEVIWGDIEAKGGSRLQDQSADLVIISNVLFQVEDRSGLLTETKRVLKRDGRVLLVDWSESFGNLGPKQEDVIIEEDAKKMFEHAGFSYVKNITAGEHHYGVVFKNTSTGERIK